MTSLISKLIVAMYCKRITYFLLHKHKVVWVADLAFCVNLLDLRNINKSYISIWDHIHCTPCPHPSSRFFSAKRGNLLMSVIVELCGVIVCNLYIFMISLEFVSMKIILWHVSILLNDMALLCISLELELNQICFFFFCKLLLAVDRHSINKCNWNIVELLRKDKNTLKYEVRFGIIIYV